MNNANIIEIAKNAKNAFLKTINLNVEEKNKALLQIAKEIEQNKDKIFEANKQDLAQAQIMLEEGKINKATFNRLKINENKKESKNHLPSLILRQIKVKGAQIFSAIALMLTGNLL